MPTVPAGFEPPLRFCGVERERVLESDVACYVYDFAPDLSEVAGAPIGTPTQIAVFKSHHDVGWFVNYSSTRIFATSVDALKLAMGAAHSAMRDAINNKYDYLRRAASSLKPLSEELCSSIDDSDFEFEPQRHTVTLEIEWTGGIDPSVAEDSLVSYVEGIHPGTPTHGGFTVTSVKVKNENH